MIYKVSIVIVVISQIIWGDVRLERIRKKLGEAEIHITGSLMHQGKTYYKNLDEIRSRCEAKPKKVKNSIEQYRSCEEAKIQAFKDSEQGVLRLENFSGIQGYLDPRYDLYKELLGVEIIYTGCIINRWSECYNEAMVNEILVKYDPEILSLLDELEGYQKENYLIDIEREELIQVDRLPSLGKNIEEFNQKVRKISCQLVSPVIYMLYEIEIDKKGKIEKVKFIRGDDEGRCMRRIKEEIENYDGWQPAEKGGRSISTIIRFQMLIWN